MPLKNTMFKQHRLLVYYDGLLCLHFGQEDRFHRGDHEAGTVFLLQLFSFCDSVILLIYHHWLELVAQHEILITGNLHYSNLLHPFEG